MAGQMNQGGLQYEFKVLGSEQIDRLQAKLKALEVQIQALSNPPSFNQQITELNRIVALKKKQVLLTSEAVRAEERLTKTLQKQAGYKDSFDTERLKRAQQLNKLATQESDTPVKNAKESAKVFEAQFKAQEKAQAQREKQAAKEAALRQKQADFNNIELQSKNKIASIQRELAIKEATYNQLLAQGNISRKEAARLAGVTGEQAKKLGVHVFDANTALRQFLFTFRRLVGILAIFTLARKFAQSIAAAVKEMADFNAKLETARIGIAQIVASVGQVRDEQGNLLTGADAFAASLQVSNNILKQIKRDALGSIATFESLVQAFQVAVGPGLASGLNLDEVRILSKRLAEGAIALGVPLNQLSEEIRSLLQGTATAKNTRLAVLFGGAKEANEAVRRAREEGNLFELLTQKLSGVAEGAKVAEQNLDVLRSNLQDTVQLLLAEGGVEQFNALKEAIAGFTNAIRETDAQGNIIFRPEALGIVQEVARTLASITNSFREMTNTGSALEAIRDTLRLIGGALRAIAPIASAAFQGLIDAVNTILVPLRVLQGVIQGVASAFGFTKKPLTETIQLVTQIVVASFVWKKLLAGVNYLLGAQGALKLLSLISTYYKRVNAAIAFSRAGLVQVNVLTAVWKALTTDVAIATTIASGGITLIIAGVIFLVSLLAAKFGLVDKFFNLFTRGSKSAVEGIDELKASFSGADKELENISSTLKDVEKQAKELAIEIAMAEALQNVEDKTKDILKLTIERSRIVKEATKEEDAQLKGLNSDLVKIRKELTKLEDVRPISSDANFEEFQRYRDALGSFRFLRERELEVLNKIANVESQRVAKIQEIDSVYAKKLRLEQISQLSLGEQSKLEESILESKGKVQEAQARQTSQSLADLIASEVKLKLLNKQEDTARRINEETRQRIAVESNEAQSLVDKFAEAPRRVKEIQKELDGLKAPDLSFVQRAQYLELSIKDPDLSLLAKEYQAELDKLAQNPEFRRQAVIQKEFEARKSILEASLSAAQAETDLLTTARANIATLEESGRQADLRTEAELNKLAAERVETEKQNRRAQLKTAKGFTDILSAGLQLGVEDFSDKLKTTAEAFADAVSSGLDGVASAFGSTFRQYLETGEDVRYFFLNALSDVFLNIAEQFATEVAKNMLASFAGETLGKFIAPAASNAPLIASNTALIASLNANTAAMGGTLPAALTANTVATSTDATSTAANTGATVANTGGLFSNLIGLVQNTAATIANTAANVASSAIETTGKIVGALAGALSGALGSVLIVSAIGLSTIAIVGAIAAQTVALGALMVTMIGLLTLINIATWGDWMTPFPFAKGGPVQGYATGGKIGGIPRPSYIPASDTVPAWLTPGEFVIKRDMVKKYGVDLLQSLNNGVLNPSSFRSAGAFSAGTSRAVQGFASGGAVGKPAFAQDSTGNRPVNVAFFDNRNALRKWAETTEGETAILNVMKKNSHLFV